ncbi:MAG: hypothetical protein HQK76_05790 [Desulfobacterales bacterium]|nr:hypothetical protein [Desulfobacterales bacterium]
MLECDVYYKGEKSNLQAAVWDKLISQPEFKALDIELGRGNQIIFKLKK